MWDCGGTIVNNFIAGNLARYKGGGLAWCSGSIVNNSISGNVAWFEGGGLYECAADEIINCIIWGNQAGVDGRNFSLGGTNYTFRIDSSQIFLSDPDHNVPDNDPSLFAGGPARGDFIFNSGDLDQAPQKIMQTEPVYPYKARQRNIEGYVKVKMLVRADGTVGEVSVLDAQPKGLFDSAALKAVPSWRFKPGVIDGQAVPSWVVTTIRFTLND